MRSLRYYMPYFAHARRFDRRNTEAVLGRSAYRITLVDLGGFVCSYLAQKELAGPLKTAA